jgi:putative transposase
VQHLRTEYTKCRWLWNECVHQFRSGQKPTTAKLDKLLTDARSKMAWLRYGSSVVQQQCVREYCVALNASFTVKKRGRPKPKTLKNNPYVSLNYTDHGFSITKDGRLKLAGNFRVPVVWSRELPKKVPSVRVYEDAAGWWWTSFVVEVPEPKPLPPVGKAIGIDWGVKTTATATDPDYDMDYHAVAAKHARNLKRYQRRMALHRKQGAKEQSVQYHRARKKAARQYRKAAWERQEHSRKWVANVVANHDQIAEENFKPKFLYKTTMAKKAHDTAVGSLRRELKYQCYKYGRTLVSVPAAFTTMTCNKCKTRAKSKLPLSQRTFQCWSCSHTADRDRNASWNVLDGAGFVPAFDDGYKSDQCGEPVLFDASASTAS